MIKRRNPVSSARPLKRIEIKRLNRLIGSQKNELRNRALIYLVLGSGIQLNELCALQIRDVAEGNQPKKKIDVVRSTIHPRQVHLSAQGRKHLLPYLMERDRLPREPLFPAATDPSTPIKPHSAAMIVRRLFDALELKDVSYNSLRRTHALALQKIGMDKKIISHQLGLKTRYLLEKFLDEKIDSNHVFGVEYVSF